MGVLKGLIVVGPTRAATGRNPAHCITRLTDAELTVAMTDADPDFRILMGEAAAIGGAIIFDLIRRDFCRRRAYPRRCASRG